MKAGIHTTANIWDHKGIDCCHRNPKGDRLPPAWSSWKASGRRSDWGWWGGCPDLEGWRWALHICSHQRNSLLQDSSSDPVSIQDAREETFVKSLKLWCQENRFWKVKPQFPKCWWPLLFQALFWLPGRNSACSAVTCSKEGNES
jgi:hypothetical protein